MHYIDQVILPKSVLTNNGQLFHPFGPLQHRLSDHINTGGPLRSDIKSPPVRQNTNTDTRWLGSIT